MNEQREEIVLGDYILTDFVQTGEYKVTVYGRKVDFSDWGNSDSEEIKNLLNQLDLWESFTLSINLINKILKEETNEISLENFYRPNKYDIELFFKRKALKDYFGAHISYTKIEAGRGTQETVAPLTVNKVKIKIKNIKKWLAIKTVIQFLRTI